MGLKRQEPHKKLLEHRHVIDNKVISERIASILREKSQFCGTPTGIAPSRRDKLEAAGVTCVQELPLTVTGSMSHKAKGKWPPSDLHFIGFKRNCCISRTSSEKFSLYIYIQMNDNFFQNQYTPFSPACMGISFKIDHWECFIWIFN